MVADFHRQTELRKIDDFFAQNPLVSALMIGYSANAGKM
jgi:hypothetical protein